MTLRVYAGGAAERRALEAWRIVSPEVRYFARRTLHEMLNFQRRCCFLCVEAMDLSNQDRSRNPKAWTWEHVFPRGVGGGERSNVLLAHRCCNDAKADRWPTPCEVIYLYAAYAEPYDAPLMRLAKTARRMARDNRRRYAIEQANA